MAPMSLFPRLSPELVHLNSDMSSWYRSDLSISSSSSDFSEDVSGCI